MITHDHAQRQRQRSAPQAVDVLCTQLSSSPAVLPNVALPMALVLLLTFLPG